MRLTMVVVSFLLALSLQPAFAEQAVTISGGALGRALLNKPGNVITSYSIHYTKLYEANVN